MAKKNKSGNRRGVGTRVKSLKQVRNLANEVTNIVENTDFSNLSKEMDKMASAAWDMSQALSKNAEYSKENLKEKKGMAKSASLAIKYATTENKIMKGLYGLRIKMSMSQDEYTKGLKKAIPSLKEMAKEGKEFFKFSKETQEKIGQMDGMFQNMGSTIKGFVLNPLTAVIAATKAISDRIDQIGKDFGAIGVKEFQQQLILANIEIMNIGGGMTDITEITKTLSNNWGMVFERTISSSDAVYNFARAVKLSNEEASNLVGMLMTFGGHSEEAAINFAKSAENMANLNKVAPGQVLADVAKNTELFAKYGKDGGNNILRASIFAKKLGLELKDVGNIMDSLLNFQTSIENEMEASILLGKQLNFDAARRLALNNDQEGAMKAILDQLGGEHEWNELNYYQRKALADSIGVGVEEMGKMVSKEKEAVSLTGELNKKSLQDLVGEDTISKVAELINKLKALGMEFAASVGPQVLGFVGGLMNMVTAIDEVIGIGNALMIMLGLMAGKAVFAASKNFILMASALGVFASKTAASTMGLAVPAALATIATIGATIWGLSAKGKAMTKLADGGIVKPTPGGTPAIIGEGGQPEAVVPLDEFKRMMKEEVTRPLIRELEQLGLKLAPAMHTIVEAFDIHTGRGYNKIGSETAAGIDKRL